MKKITVLIVLIFLSKIACSQNPVEHKDSIKYKHEFGLDASTFVKQFFNLNTSSVSYSYPVYYLTYRYHLKKSNIRVAFGGNFKNDNDKAFGNNTARENDVTKSFYARFGYEFVSKISTRWNVFYGMDFRPSTSFEKYDNTNTSSGYTQSNYTKSKTFGFAPLLGAKYQLNKRISLSTEVSLTFYYGETRVKSTFTPIANQPKKDDENKRDDYVWATSFSPPVFIIFAIDL